MVRKTKNWTQNKPIIMSVIILSTMYIEKYYIHTELLFALIFIKYPSSQFNSSLLTGA